MRKLFTALSIIPTFLIGTTAFAVIGIDSSTVLMLHFNGTDGSSSFIDDSFSNHTVTAHGNAQIDTSQKKLGTGSLFLDGDDDYLEIGSHANWDLGSGDFTIDAWWNTPNNAPDSQYMVGHMKPNWVTPGAYGWLLIFNGGSDRLSFTWSTTGSDSNWKQESWNPSNNTWYHSALVRNGNDLSMYIDGTEIGTTTDVTGVTIYDPLVSLYIGKGFATVGTPCWMDELRVSKGIARWTSDFTPPTSEYTLAPPEVIPEPSSLLLLGFSFLGALFRKRS